MAFISPSIIILLCIEYIFWENFSTLWMPSRIFITIAFLYPISLISLACIVGTITGIKAGSQRMIQLGAALLILPLLNLLLLFVIDLITLLKPWLTTLMLGITLILTMIIQADKIISNRDLIVNIG